MDVFWNDPLLTSVNNVGSKTLFNPVKQQAQRFLPCRGQMHGITNYPIAFPYLYRSRTCDICKISTFNVLVHVTIIRSACLSPPPPSRRQKFLRH